MNGFWIYVKVSFTLHDFTCMLLSVIVQTVQPTVQDVEAESNPIS